MAGIAFLALALAMPAQMPAQCSTSAQIQELDEATLAKVKPIAEKRAAIADRLVELTEKNPLGRGVSSLFDRNSDPKYLRKLNEDLGV